MITDKDNVPLVKPVVPKKHSNIPAYIIAGLITATLLAGGVMYASEKLSNFLTTEFQVEVASVNLN